MYTTAKGHAKCQWRICRRGYNWRWILIDEFTDMVNQKNQLYKKSVIVKTLENKLESALVEKNYNKTLILKKFVNVPGFPF